MIKGGPPGPPGPPGPGMGGDPMGGPPSDGSGPPMGGGPPGGLLLELEGGRVPPGGRARGLALGRGGTPAQGPQ